MMFTFPLERLRQADLPRAMRMALVAVEIVVDFGIAQRAEPAVLLVEIEVAEAAVREVFPCELAVVAVIIDEPSEIIEEHKALVLRKLRRVDLEAADVALVRTRHTLLNMNGRGIRLVSQTTSPRTEISPPRRLTKSCPMG